MRTLLENQIDEEQRDVEELERYLDSMKPYGMEQEASVGYAAGAAEGTRGGRVGVQ